jgi:excisionase family DNA binding protein
MASAVLTVPEFAEALNVSHRTVYRWVKSGHVRTLELSGARSVRIHRSELARILASGLPDEKAAS